MPPSRFAVGDRAEYWSDTYQLWMPGIVQRVRDGGAAYDLDVKRGAQASKLRLARVPSPPAQDSEALFSIVDRNHDGIISRSEFQGAIQSHVIEGTLSSTTRSLEAPCAAAPPLVPARIGKPSSLSASARGAGGTRQDLADLAARRQRPASREPEASQLGRRVESAAASRQPSSEARGKSPRSTALQARQLHSEIANATRAIQAQSGEWAEHAGQDMVSRAGAVTVRKMVETTKAMLQGLEGALILRAGFIAGCFHMWRCETTLSRAGRLYQEEFERHHDQWAAHLDHHKQSFEAELRAHAEHGMSYRERVRQQQALLLDTWAHGERQALRRGSFRAWRTHVHREKGLKRIAARIHTAVFTWAEGKTKGLKHSVFAAWHHLQAAQREVRMKEAEMGQLHSSFKSQLEEQQRKHDELMREKMLAIEAMEKGHIRSIEVALAKWERGGRKGMLTVCFQAWRHLARSGSAKRRLAGSVEMELKRWIEGKARGDLHCCYIHWQSLAKHSALAKRHQAQLEAEQANLQRMLADQEKSHTDLLHRHQSEAERLRERQKNTVEVALAKWEFGGKRGLFKSTFQHWANFATEAKRLARNRQAVHSSMLRSLEGDRTASMHISFVNWAGIARSEKHMRLMEDGQAAHIGLHQEKDSKIEMLERQVEQFVSHHDTKLKRYGELLASKSKGAVKGMCFSAWKDESKGVKGELEAQRLAEVRMEEMERAHKMADTMHKQEKLRALDAMGCKGSRVHLFETFTAWSYLVQRAKDAQAVKLNHNEAMQKYSSFVIEQKLKKDASALLASCFAEWHREGKILYHQRCHQEALKSSDETRGYVEQLQEQLSVCYQQIDLITETLQKELKTKEELATELRNAYSKMRTKNFTPTTAASERGAANDIGALSRTSSDQTIDQVVSTPRAPHRPAFGGQQGGSGQCRLNLTGAALPPSPSLPTSARCSELLRGRGPLGGPASRDASPSQFGWDRVVERMGEEGLVRVDRRGNR